jgi:SAM-dependent methyltransferase
MTSISARESVELRKDSEHHHLHPVRSRLNAWFFWLMDGYVHRKYGELKRSLFGGLPQTVVELGPGTGVNFRYFPRGTRVIAIEPNLHMHPLLRRNAQRHGIDLTIQARVDAGLQLSDESVELVIATLVLCTVDDPAAVLSEVRRVLRPGGRFLCIEHVAAPQACWVGRVQRVLARPWAYVFEGCHTHRDTARTLEAAGFSQVQIERFDVDTLFVPIRPQLAATLVK